MNILLVITTIQSWFFLSLVLSQKKEKQVSDYILAIWLFFIGLHTLIHYFMHEYGVYNIYIAMVNVAFPFLQGPLLFIYVLTRTKNKTKLDVIHYLHFIPFLAFVAYQCTRYYLASKGQSEAPGQTLAGFSETFNVFNTFFLISLPVYIAASVYITFPKDKSKNRNTTWVRLLILFVAGIWISSLLSSVLPEFVGHQNQIRFNSLTFISLTGFVYLISYFGVKEQLFATDIPKLQTGKYAKSRMPEKEADEIWANLRNYMKTKEPFLDPELDLNGLASQLNITSNKLSQVINTKTELNFYDLINQFRIEKVKELMQNDKFLHYTILGLAFEAGFTSKATFNRVFRKMENCTPSEFRKTLKH